jgi:hypothetical protein
MEATVLAVLGLEAAVFWAAGSLEAQGVTGAAIEGRVVRVDSTPVEQAVVHVTNTSNGERWRTTTSARGRYFIEYLSVGGPYRIEVRALGYLPAQRDSILLALGQRLAAHFALIPAVVQLQEITVTGTNDPRLSAARTGPAQFISDTTIARLPVRGRDYTSLARLSPQVTVSPNGGLSFAGQHDRYNSIQIDGTNNNDPFGRRQSGNGRRDPRRALDPDRGPACRRTHRRGRRIRSGCAVTRGGSVRLNPVRSAQAGVRSRVTIS